MASDWEECGGQSACRAGPPRMLEASIRIAQVPRSRYTARAQAGHPNAARTRKVMAAECAGEVVNGSADRTIISRKSHGRARKTSHTNMARRPRVAGLNAESVPTAAAAAVVIAEATIAPAMLSRNAAATRNQPVTAKRGQSLPDGAPTRLRGAVRDPDSRSCCRALLPPQWPSETGPRAAKWQRP